MKEECRLILERVYLFLDGEILSEEERIQIQCHIDECIPCYERFGVEREVQTILSRLAGAQRCPMDLRSRIDQLLQE